jgi:SAM-dependent methyltransferase
MRCARRLGFGRERLDYDQTVACAPPGWRHFTMEDLRRLPPGVRRRELSRVPRGEPDERVLRAMFWPLVYHLEPERWDALARCEPIHPSIVDALPTGSTLAVDVGAGGGRLTAHLAARSRRTVAIEPSEGLRAILAGRLPATRVVAGWSDELPLAAGCSGLTAACGVFGPDRGVLEELRRVTAPGGVIALVNPELPEWFERHGWRRLTAPPTPPLAHEPWIDDFFGPPDPPRELLTLTVPD